MEQTIATPTKKAASIRSLIMDQIKSVSADQLKMKAKHAEQKKDLIEKQKNDRETFKAKQKLEKKNLSDSQGLEIQEEVDKMFAKLTGGSGKIAKHDEKFKQFPVSGNKLRK